MCEDPIKDEPMNEPEFAADMPQDGADMAARLDGEQASEPLADPAPRPDSSALVPGQRRLSEDERSLLLKLLVAGQREGLILQAFEAMGLEPPASSTLNYYRQKYREEIREAQAARVERAMTEGLALKAERIAKLKEHAELLEAMRFIADRNGRLWNERAWRQTLADIAAEMGERGPAQEEDRGEVVKVIIGVDPDRV